MSEKCGKNGASEWPLTTLSRNLAIASRASSQRKSGYDRRWPVVVCRMVDILRDEVARMKAVDNWNLGQKFKNNRPGRGRPNLPKLDRRGLQAQRHEDDDDEE